MKYCHRMFDYIYFDSYDGNVFICPWMEPARSSVGNILEQDFDEIWRGDRAEKIRASARDGSYSYCRAVACPHLQNDDLPEGQGSPDTWEAAVTPKEVNLAFDFICNISCPTCRCEIFVPDEDYPVKVEAIVNKVIPLAAKADRLTASGHGDPFASPYMMKVLENLHPGKENYEIMLETNGIFLDEAHWDRIKHLGDFNLQIVVTTNSYNEPIYSQISRGGDLEKLKRNQLFLKSLREKGKVKHTVNGIVVQERNYWEIPDFIKKSLEVYGFDEVVLKPVYNWGNLSDEEYWYKDVLNPCHPYHEDYKRIISMPIVKDNPRVYNFGGETMHEAKPMPGRGPKSLKEAAYFKLFQKWLSHDNIKSFLLGYLKDNNYKKCLIYGAGDVGRAIARLLGKSEGIVNGFVDKYICEKQIDGIPVFKMDNETIKEADIIIVTPVHAFEEIRRNLQSSGCDGKIISIADLL